MWNFRSSFSVFMTRDRDQFFFWNPRNNPKKNWFHEGGATLQQLRNPRRRWGHLTRSFRLPYCSSHFKFQCFSHLPRGWISFHYRMASADKIPSSNQRLHLHGTTARGSSAGPTWRLGLLGKFEFDLVSIVAQTKRPYPLIATSQPSQSSLLVKRILLISLICCCRRLTICVVCNGLHLCF